jgi:osmotically-inducible protein OsmY
VINFLVSRQIPGLKAIQIDAHGGTVTLRGKVTSPKQKRLCANCCQRVAGVVRVIDALQILP